jgi:hypothetical protein
MKWRFLFSMAMVVSMHFFILKAGAQNVGIGITAPLAKLHVDSGHVVFTESGPPSGTPGIPAVQGPGRRLLWYPDKAAFRAGYVDNTRWDQPFIGVYSFAGGFNTVASALGSTAFGHGSMAEGEMAIAMGQSCLAAGDHSIAMGYVNHAGGTGSVSMGAENVTTGSYTVAIGGELNAMGRGAVALGESNFAEDENALALGNNARATGLGSIAIGHDVTASGVFSIALGSRVSTSGFHGSLTIGDRSGSTVMQTFVANGFRSRFAGGYRLFTNPDATIGAFLNANANSWAALSDVRLKENFLPVDGEAVLYKIAAMPQYTWNYIGQDVKTLRHYGPMAQDFYGAFGKDALGEIGCDTLINQQDFLGINLIAIQALEKRTASIQKELDDTKILLKQNQLQLAELKEQKRLLVELLKKNK